MFPLVSRTSRPSRGLPAPPPACGSAAHLAGSLLTCGFTVPSAVDRRPASSVVVAVISLLIALSYTLWPKREPAGR